LVPERASVKASAPWLFRNEGFFGGNQTARRCEAAKSGVFLPRRGWLARADEPASRTRDCEEAELRLVFGMICIRHVFGVTALPKPERIAHTSQRFI
jgi:hypothetical protein